MEHLSSGDVNWRRKNKVDYLLVKGLGNERLISHKKPVCMSP